MRAILSVANKEGLLDLARELHEREVSLFATGKTFSSINGAELPVQSISDLTHFPEILDGRVKTLHPAVHAGILARRDLPAHLTELESHGLAPIDVVIANLYPFAETIARPETSLAEAIEQIDIGGVTLIRAAAKNYRDVLIIVRPEDYAPVLQEWREEGEVSMETRRRLAITAYQHTALYDTLIAEYLRKSTGDQFPEHLTLPLERKQALRYGENPHQQAAFYKWAGVPSHTKLPTIAEAEVLHGKELSYNNILDLDAALATVQTYSAPTVAIIKHNNPCGLSCDEVLVEAYKKAHAGDPVSAYGGIVGLNRTVDVETAQELAQLFYEAIIAPGYAPEALAILSKKKNIRLLATNCPIGPESLTSQTLHLLRPEVRAVSGGLLVQTPDIIGLNEIEYQVITDREPTLDEVTDLIFAWKAVKHVKSNAIALAHKLTLLGIGAGQMNRVTSVQIAIEKAGERARGSVLASDAYFPFADNVENAAKAGITAIIQPGGSIRDEESIKMANKYAIAMVFTGKRHFRH